MSLLPKQLRTDQRVRDAREAPDYDTPVPEGTYTVELVKITQRETKAGKPRLNFEMALVADQYGQDLEGGLKGRRVFAAANVDDQGADWLIRYFDAFGIPHDADEEDVKDHYGTEALAKVIVQEWNGELQNDVRSLRQLIYSEEAPANAPDPEVVNPGLDPDADDDWS